MAEAPRRDRTCTFIVSAANRGLVLVVLLVERRRRRWKEEGEGVSGGEGGVGGLANERRARARERMWRRM
jgi:hypothetical protein